MTPPAWKTSRTMALNSTSFDRGGSNQPSVSYSIPLILDDGTVYGVLGVDLLTNYLFTMLPYGELFDDKQGSYILAVEEEFGVFEPAMISGTIQQRLSPGARLYLEKSVEGSGLVELDGKSYYVDVDYLNLYNSNTPFAGQRWALLGVVSEQLLYAFSHTVLTLLYLAVFLTFLVGAFSIFIISRKLSQPIKSLSQEVERAQMESMEIPQLSITGVTEIDNLTFQAPLQSSAARLWTLRRSSCRSWIWRAWSWPGSRSAGTPGLCL